VCPVALHWIWTLPWILLLNNITVNNTSLLRLLLFPILSFPPPSVLVATSPHTSATPRPASPPKSHTRAQMPPVLLLRHSLNLRCLTHTSYHLHQQAKCPHISCQRRGHDFQGRCQFLGNAGGAVQIQPVDTINSKFLPQLAAIIPNSSSPAGGAAQMLQANRINYKSRLIWP
jgi:hypothetical protein